MEEPFENGQAGVSPQQEDGLRAQEESGAPEAARQEEKREIGAQTLLEEEPGEARREAQAEEAQARMRETYDALCALEAQGFTLDELRALSEDEAVRGDIAQGTPLEEAAYAWRERQADEPPREANGRPGAHRRGVPTLRAASPDTPRGHDWLENMSDAEFDRFSRRMKEAALMGKRVRI